MIIVFILGYVLVGILIQLLGNIAYKEEQLKMGYLILDDVMFKGVDNKEEIKSNALKSMNAEQEEDFNFIMYDPKCVIINVLGWPANIVLWIVYVIKLCKIFKGNSKK